MERIQIQLEDDQLTALRRQASVLGRSVAGLVREAVAERLARTPRRSSLRGLRPAFRSLPLGAELADHDRGFAEAAGGAR
jgi:hypothetical protein